MRNDNPDRKWEVIGSEYICRRPWLTARRDHVRLPNGVENDEYYVLEYPEWVNIIARTPEGKFVLVRQYRHGIGQTLFELCAGVVDPDDASPLDAAKRELYEETGYGGGHWTAFLTVAPNASAMTNMSHTFLATDVVPVSTQHLEATEDISVHLVDANELLRMLQTGIFVQALMAAPLWKYFCEQNMR